MSTFETKEQVSAGGVVYRRRVRFHKFVHFYLMRYLSGDVSGHDEEVNEARWVEFEKAEGMLAFKGERKALGQAREMFATGAGG